MVTTLIKYEFLRTRGWVAMVFGAATLLTVVGMFMAFLPWELIQGFGVFLALLGFGGFLMVVQLGLAVDYWRSSYRKVGYFTQSLPVKGSTIYGAKLMWGSIVTVVALLWNVVLAVPLWLGASDLFGLEISFGLDLLQTMFAAAPVWAWVVLAIVLIAMYVAGLADYYFAASIGSESGLNRLGIGGPILAWFVLYMVMQVLLMIGIVAFPFILVPNAAGDGFAIDSMNMLTSMLNNEDVIGMPLGFLPVTLVITAALIWRTAISWNKKVSLA